MAAQQDLDAAIGTIETKLATLSTDLTSALSDLEAKIAGSGTTVDFQPEIDRLNAVATSLDTATAGVVAADPGPTV